MISSSLSRALEAGHDLAELGVDVGSGHRSGGDRVVQVADRRALLGEIGHEFAARQQCRIELLFVLIVGPDPGDERSGADHRARDEPAPRRRAGDDDVARRDGGRQVGHGRYRQPGLSAERGRKGARLFPVLVVNRDALGAAHAQQRAQLRGRLTAAAADQRHPALPARQILGRHGGRGRRAQRRDRHRIHNRERLASDRVAQHDDALDRRQPVPRAIMREIGVGLRREIGPLEGEQRRLDVKTAVLGVQAEDAWRRSLPERVLAKGVLDCGHAFVGGEQPLDIAA